MTEFLNEKPKKNKLRVKPRNSAWHKAAFENCKLKIENLVSPLLVHPNLPRVKIIVV
ncbi:MAG: hypothetical protein UW45_C0037G0003 [Parcubacteria group bacterium GW2011_GWC2_44_22]|nr:MAG: hypothetical protein UW45_C0037G0003 [Parcubacteria group bacterium GW2011_GWC2_44_22]